MNDDDRDRGSADAGDATWIESLGLSADEQHLIRHSLDMADAVIQRDERATEAGAGRARAPDEADPTRDAEAGARVVREGPPLPAPERTEPYVQPRPVLRVVNRTNHVAERRRR